MKNIILTLLLFFLLIVTLPAQNLNEVYRKANRKLKNDKSYLNIHSIRMDFTAEQLRELRNIPRTDKRGFFNFKSSDNVNYYFVVILKSIEFDSLVPLYCIEETNLAEGDEAGFLQNIGTQSQYDSTMVLTFKDVQELYFDHPEYYSVLYDAIENQSTIEKPQSLLGILITDDINKSKGMTSMDNSDYLHFNWVNNRHRFPTPSADVLGIASRRRGGATTTTQEMMIDASFSHATFFHNQMDLDYTSISGEITTDVKGLNLLPWQSMTLSGGIRALVTLSDDKRDLMDDFIVDARILGRFRLNTSSIFTNMPTYFVEEPLLNVGSGVLVDVSLSKVYNLPFFSFFFSSGFEDLEDPYVTVGPADSSTGYFSFSQWQAFFSFYWNTNENRILRFRMDVGAGSYNVVEAFYENGTLINSKSAYNSIQPVINLYITFVPNDVELFGTHFKVFDSVLRAGFWLKILQFDEHIFRLETEQIFKPMFRHRNPWETESATMMQIRYRYGF